MSKKYVSPSKLAVFLDNLKNTFASLSHKHTTSDLTDYQVDSALSETSTSPLQNKVINEEFATVARAMGILEGAIDDKADADHNHDDKYYTESEIDTKFEEKEPLYVNITVNIDDDGNETYSADKTFTEINEAYEANRLVYANTNSDGISLRMPLVACIEEEEFGAAAFVVDDGAGVNGVVIYNDGTVEYAYQELVTPDQIPEVPTVLPNPNSMSINGVSYDGSSSKDFTSTINDMIDGKTSGKADASHTHAISDVANLQNTLDNKVPNTRTVNGKALSANVTLSASDVGAAASSHTHDDRYYTESEMDELLSGKSASTHSHTITASASDDDVVILTGTNGTNQVTYSASHANSGVTAGTYKSVTVNAKGHVTAGSNPTTLEGFGISDAYTKVETDTELAKKMNAANPVGTGSFSMNRKSGTTVGTNSHAEGDRATASGDYSHAEGSLTTASGNYSHAEGNYTTASGKYSHAEGSGTEASNECSHAEGYDTTASGTRSHAEGYGTTASGINSHAEGSNTTASGLQSHAEGNSTVAKGANQHVQGKYNIEDTSSKYAHIVGNGTASTPSNAHTLDWNGNAWYKGNVYVGGDDQASGNKLLTETEVDSKLSGKANATHSHDDLYYTELEVDTKLSGKANTSHTHAASDITSGTLSTDRLPTVPVNKGGTGATTAAGALSNLGLTATATELNIMDGVTATTAEINKLDGLTATTAELNFVDGVTSGIQEQLDGKQATVTGGASTITSSNLTANRALISNGSGKVAVSAVTSTELGYLDGVTSNIQNQLDGTLGSDYSPTAITNDEIDEICSLTIATYLNSIASEGVSF